MELDHIFIFTQESEQVAQSLRYLGLSEGTPNIHPGQGTACRRFFFHNAYLELAWVIDEQEIKSPAVVNTKLWERSQYQSTKYCPFGLCFRAIEKAKDKVSLLFDDGWHYYSSFLPEGQFANIASNANFPAEPMLFEMPFFGIAPKDYPLEKQQPLNHTNGFKEITKISLTLPTPSSNMSLPLQKVLRNDEVNVFEGEEYRVCIEFDGAKIGKMQNFHHLLPLIMKW
jgi:hypothetical protein